MKKISLLISTLFLFSYFIYAQEIKKNSNGSACAYIIQVKYPDLPVEEKLNGTVIVEYEVDSLCVASNPKIIQSLGLDYDKEVLRVTKLLISVLNKCNLKCKQQYCEKRKMKLPINFVDGNEL